MKASIKFREEKTPLLRAKIPINILNYPFQSGVVAGESKELSLNLGTYFESGPAVKFAYRPNDSETPFSVVFKTGIGHFGSPIHSPLTMSAEFNVIGCENPSFYLRFKPDLGDFSVKKLISSAIVRKLTGNSNSAAADEGNFVKNVARLFPAMESKAAAGWLVNGIVRGTDLTATTALPLRDRALVHFRWGLRVPRSGGAGGDYEATRRRSSGGYRLPQLVMDKIGIEHVARGDSLKEKAGPAEEYDRLAGACLDVKKQLEVIQAKNGSLNKALTDFRSDLAAGKMEIVPENGRNNGSPEVEEGLKVV